MGQPRRPVIGITCYVESIDRPPWVSQPSAVLPRMYLEHVARAGGIPVILPPGDEHLTDAEADAQARFRLAVQWHPEAAEDSSLFRSLVAAATTWSASRDTLSGSGPE